MKPDKQFYISLILPCILGCYGLWFSLALFLMAFGMSAPAEYMQAIGSLLSAIAVGAAFFSIFVQQRNFDAQITELRADSFHKMYDLLLEIHEKSASQISHNGKTGRYCVADFMVEFKKSQFLSTLYNAPFNKDNYNDSKKEYDKSVTPNYIHLFQYLNTLSLMLHVVDEEKTIDETKKRIYTDAIKARLSEDELTLLLYHTIFTNPDNNLTKISNRYSLYETIKGESQYSVVRNHYSPSAFGLPNWDSVITG